MILRDFKCCKCNKVFEDLVNRGELSTRCECGGLASFVITKSNLVNVTSFNPYYDLQLGRHFNSNEDKKDYLRKAGKSQISGHGSPRKSNGTSIICSSEQAKRLGTAPANEQERQAWKKQRTQ